MARAWGGEGGWVVVEGATRGGGGSGYDACGAWIALDGSEWSGLDGAGLKLVQPATDAVPPV